MVGRPSRRRTIQGSPPPPPADHKANTYFAAASRFTKLSCAVRRGPRTTLFCNVAIGRLPLCYVRVDVQTVLFFHHLLYVPQNHCQWHPSPTHPTLVPAASCKWYPRANGLASRQVQTKRPQHATPPLPTSLIRFAPSRSNSSPPPPAARCPRSSLRRVSRCTRTHERPGS